MPGGDTYSVFSIDDLFATAQLIDDGDVNTSSFVMFLVTGKETYYALTISNKTKYLKFFKSYLEEKPTEYNLLLDWLDAQNRFNNVVPSYYNKENSGLIKTSSTDKVIDLEYFLNFVNEADIGVNLFKSEDSSFTNISKVELSDNGNVISRSCNQNRR